MSVQGLLFQHGVGVGGGRDTQLSFLKTGLIVQPPTTGPFTKAPLPYPDPSAVIDFFDDFFKYIGDGSDVDGWVEYTEGTNDYTVGLGSYDGHGGELVLQSTDPPASDDLITLRTNYSIAKVAANSPLWFAARVMGYSQSKCDLYTGLMSYTGTPVPSDAAKMTNLAGFKITSTLYPHVLLRKAGTDTLSQALSDQVTDAEYVELGMYVDGDYVYFYVDGSLEYTKSRSGNFPVVDLYPFVSVKSAGATTQHAVAVDYIRSISLR